MFSGVQTKVRKANGLAPYLMPFPVRDAAARECERRRREGETVIETPTKRRRMEANDVDTALVAVKREQSPISLQPFPNQARTSGVVFVKYPSNCLPGEDSWKKNRDRCLLEETTKLQALGLKIVRRLVRDDGLAFDWASDIPIDPVNLKPPNPTLNTTQVPVNRVTSSQSDLLGHALRDQVVTLRQSLVSAEPATQPPPNVARLMNVDRSVTLVEASSGEDSGFAVVGAALKNIPSHDEQRTPSSCPKEYRRLIPQEFRIYRQVENKFKYRLHEPLDRRRRRMEWIQKEIEKIEGYTGEKVAGYRYERNDVIITLKDKNKAKVKHTFNQSKDPQPSRPTPLGPKTYKNPPSKEADKPQPTKNAVSLVEAPCPTKPLPKQQLLESAQPHSLQRVTRSDSSPDLRDRIQRKELSLPRSSEDSSSSRTSSSSFSTRREMPNYPSGSLSNTPSATTKRPGNQESPIVISSSSPPSHGGRSDMSVSPSPPPSFSPQTASTPMFPGRSPPPRQDPGTMVTRGLRFLEQYLTLYDTNRKALTSAFTPNATFSLSHDEGAKPRPKQVTTGPSAIVQAIENLDDDLHHSIRGNISYDMTPLDDVDLGAILLTCDGTIVPRDHSTPARTFSRIFVLRRNTDHDRDVWPLKISTERLGIKQI